MKLLEGRLITVSNRLPVEIKHRGGQSRLSRSAGGLATALDSIWRFCHGIWVGWAGAVDSGSGEHLLEKASRGRTFSFKAVPLSRDEVSKFYSGFANEIIWPLFHDMPSRCDFDPEYWEVYQRINRRFAQAAGEAASGKDLVWVHDYHLMLMGRYLRETRSAARAGFFLHIPFPAPDIFEKLPWRKPVLRALLQYDVVGFQTDRDHCNFLSCIERILPEARSSRDESHTKVVLEGRCTRVGNFPISIAFEEFANHAASHDVEAAAQQFRHELGNKYLVLGVDRMDYTKGIPERLKAFRILLRRFPELRHRVTLLQVVVPSREEIPNYKELRREVELLVSQINGEFTESGWVPIHYMHRSLTRKQLVTYYRAADIVLVTSLKDGMNLVAKEFCAAQVDESGVVVISEFTGAAAELQHGAVVVNPNDLAGVAEAIHRACVMPLEEKRSRMRLLRDIVRTYNVQSWAEAFLNAVLMAEPAVVGAAGSSGEDTNFPLIASSSPQNLKSA
ncbi:MAG: trehalose-6-phosphate synthase [Acidobacteria bacterium]|nr:trehalose-6-phosphate synthase [Acidobacteriota bacterium]MBV9625979.1 trehalose-6-phosphate synthase [Acidobacteriota bacterium]